MWKKRLGWISFAYRWLFQQLIIAVDYMHRRGLAHRDIKMENILLDNSQRPIARICDFGFSKHTTFESRPHSTVGTADYLSPEMLRGKQATYDGKVYESLQIPAWLIICILLILDCSFSGTDHEAAAILMFKLAKYWFDSILAVLWCLGLWSSPLHDASGRLSIPHL